MHIVLLKLSGDKARAAELMEGHRAWLQQGFDDGFFIASGNLTGQPGGSILVRGLTDAQLAERLSRDPFVAQGVVTTEQIGLQVTKTNAALDHWLHDGLA